MYIDERMRQGSMRKRKRVMRPCALCMHVGVNYIVFDDFAHGKPQQQIRRQQHHIGTILLARTNATQTAQMKSTATTITDQTQARPSLTEQNTASEKSS